MTATLAETKLALYLLFATDDISQRPVAALETVDTVYNYEPRPGDALGPVWLTVSTFKGDEMNLEFNVRLYGKPDNPAQVQADLDAGIQAVWTILEAHDQFVVPGFEAGSLKEIDLLVASFKVSCGRADRAR